MALRNGCSPIGRLARLAPAALISVSAFSLPARLPKRITTGTIPHHGQSRAPPLRTPSPYAVGHMRATASRAGPWSAAAGIARLAAFSAIVVDANTGRTLYSVATKTRLRHPASITKVMTLYLLFEQLDKGAMTLRHADSGLGARRRAGAVEARHPGRRDDQRRGCDQGGRHALGQRRRGGDRRGDRRDEDTFADMMTRKAHALGMSQHALSQRLRAAQRRADHHGARPHRSRRSLEERFPRYFNYFSTHEFEYDGEIIGNHNHLLGRVDGVDGIKTGYTRASGFNLLTSVHRDGRSLVAVVMGGRTAARATGSWRT